MPAVAGRVILRNAQIVPVGARPALAEFNASAFLAGVDDIAAEVTREAEPVIPLFQRHLGEVFDALPPAARAGHDVAGPRIWAGRARVTRGAAWTSQLIAAVMLFPAATDDVAVTVTMMPRDWAERWVRQFGSQKFRSTLRQRGDSITERFGPMTFELGLNLRDGALHYPVLRGWFWKIPMPKFLLPKSVSHEAEDAQGRLTFDVSLIAPITGALVVRYQGHLERAKP